MEEINAGDKLPVEGNSLSNKGKPYQRAAIIGYNILILVLYTLILKLAASDSGVIFDAFFLLVHVGFCMCMAFGKNGGWWLLSGLLVLIIGFSTCIYIPYVH